ncbi:MAG: hypothetical protein LBJ91_04815 [Clostridiales Family XIII bacterium]|jgi:hypothetical protein|nr:hypothetical protein [Clostridiales Family XIII bacterium]
MKRESIRRGNIARVGPLLALALVLVISSFTLASADGKAQNGTSDDPAEVAITKVLQMPIGTSTPTYTYTFTFTNKEKVGNDATVPTIGNEGKVTISFDGNEGFSTTGGIKTVTKETADVLTGVTWPTTGIYIYTVEEAASVTDGSEVGDGWEESLTYSKAKYKIEVYVAESGGSFYVQYVKAHRAVDDEGEDVEENDASKVNVAPGDGDTTGSHPFSGMAFTNKYVKTNTNGFDEEEEDLADNTSTGALYIGGKISGNMADSTLPFAVDVSLTKPSVVTQSAFYAYLVDGNGNKVASPAAVYDDPDKKTYTFTVNEESGEASHNPSVELISGQRLVFVNLPVGMTYNTGQEGTPNYAKTLTVKYGMNSMDILGGSEAAAVAGAGVNTEALSETNPEALMIGEDGGNGVVYTHDYGITTPTGVVIENLPYILLVLLVLAGLVAYIAGRSRRRRRDARC